MGCAGDAIREVVELAQDKAEIRPVKSRAHLKKSLIAMRCGWRLPPLRTSRVCARSPALIWRRPDRVTWLPLRNWPIGSTAGQRRRLWATMRPHGLAITIRCRVASARLHRSCDQLREPLARVEGARLHRRLVDADDLGDLLDGFAMIIGKVDDLAVLRR